MSGASINERVADAPRFAIFTGPGCDPGCESPDGSSSLKSQASSLSPSMTLPEFYAAFVLPTIRRLASPKTIEQDRNALNHWTALTRSSQGREPAIGDIDDAMAAEFAESLAAREWCGSRLSPNTVRKVCTHLQFILDAAGPRRRGPGCGRRRTAQLLEEPPYFERPPQAAEEPTDVYTLQEIGLWIDAVDAGAARRSKNLPWFSAAGAARWWRSLILFAYNTGLRIETIMGATWDMIDRDPRLPGWIIVPAAIAKGQRGGRYYLNHAARAAIESLGTRRQSSQGGGAIFPWRGWPATANWLHASRRKMQERSALQPGRRFGFHALRKALATWLAARDSMVAAIVLGHRGGVTQRHYVNSIDVVPGWLEQVPQPPAALAGKDPKQPMLFR